MRNLPLPTRATASGDLELAIRRYRYRNVWHGHEITPAEIVNVLALYDRYDADSGVASDMLRGTGFPAALIDALEAAFDKTQKGRMLYSLRERLFDGVKHCPICGIDPPVELDHFLPRSEFKPLAIYSRNLVPICHACNLNKLAGFGDQDGNQLLFLHAYFDIFPDIQFLKAEIDISDGGLVVCFTSNPDVVLPGNYATRLDGQMKALKLNKRYDSEINTYMSGHAVSLHLNHSTGGQAAVRRFLRAQAVHERGEFHRNHWRPTLLSALAAHHGFTSGGFAEVLPVSTAVLQELASL